MWFLQLSLVLGIYLTSDLNLSLPASISGPRSTIIIIHRNLKENLREPNNKLGSPLSLLRNILKIQKYIFSILIIKHSAYKQIQFN